MYEVDQLVAAAALRAAPASRYQRYKRGAATSRAVVKRLRYRCLTSAAGSSGSTAVSEQNGSRVLLQCLTPHGLVMLLYGLSQMKAWQPESFKQQLLLAAEHQLQQAIQQYSSSTAQNPHTPGGFKPQELPVVLLSLTQLQIVLPTVFLQQFEAVLLPQLQLLSPGQLCLCMFALGAARHRPGNAFAAGVTGQLAAVLPAMDHRSLAMTLWGLAQLQSRPSEQLLRCCVMSTSRLLRKDGMTLLSLTTILSAMRCLNYLPPLPWMIEGGVMKRAVGVLGSSSASSEAMLAAAVGVAAAVAQQWHP
eukprot:gene13189-13320_t